MWVSSLSVDCVSRSSSGWCGMGQVASEAPSRPQGGGRRRHGDRQVLAAIVCAATASCAWPQLPSASFGPSRATAHRRFSK
ncbi:transposase [Streptomyces sp. B3I8]|uniref:transposase n=1 Tax=Streptomyces sp. B3I8 TaxID=3042303 RepID=UPI00358E5194